MNKRIRVNGRLYEQVATENYHHSNRHNNRKFTEAWYDEYALFPKKAGKWSISHSDGMGMEYDYDGIPSLNVRIAYDRFEDALNVAVIFDGDGSIARDYLVEDIIIKNANDDDLKPFLKKTVAKILRALDTPFNEIAPKIDDIMSNAMQSPSYPNLLAALKPFRNELDGYLDDLGSKSNKILRRIEKRTNR